MPNEPDLYAVLGVDRTVDADALRSAYRKLARKYHPDVNPGDKAAEERFKQISAAHDVLSDKARRKLYDEFGMAGLREGFDADKARAYGAWSGGGGAGGPGAGFGSSGAYHAGGVEFDLGDLFGDMFGRRAPRQARESRGRDIVAHVEVDFVQAIDGTSVNLQVPIKTSCGRCSGTGSAGGPTAVCDACGGKGSVEVPGLRMRSPCPSCQGKGKRAAPCLGCGGSGMVDAVDTVEVRIPKGADQGSKLRVPGRGERGLNGGPAGDLLIEMRIRPHPFFKREGNDLFLRLPVTVSEAYHGATVEVPTPGGKVSLKVPPRSQQGTRLRLRGKGVSRKRATGDLYVDLEVRMPDRDDPAISEALLALENGYSAPVRATLTL